METYASLPSTNDRARELARQGAPEGTWVVADEQTRGRGRHGRAWSSPAGLGIWCSLVLRPRLEPRECPRLVVWASLAVARTVKAFVEAPVGVKWPNDVLVGGRKVAGILLEAETRGKAVPWAVVGIGLNVNQRPEDFPPELRGRATSLRGARAAVPGVGPDPEPLDRERVLQRLMEELYSLHLREASRRFAGVVEEVRACSLTLGRRVRVREESRVWEGVAVDFTPDGMLQVRDGEGVARPVVSGDVELVEGEYL